MSCLPYTSLTNEQRARVAYLFADEVFGTDASAFVYEVSGDEVMGRTAEQKAEGKTQKRARQLSPVNVTMLQEATITNELIHSTRMHFDALAAYIANHLNQEVSL